MSPKDQELEGLAALRAVLSLIETQSFSQYVYPGLCSLLAQRVLECSGALQRKGALGISEKEEELRGVDGKMTKLIQEALSLIDNCEHSSFLRCLLHNFLIRSKFQVTLNRIQQLRKESGIDINQVSIEMLDSLELVDLQGLLRILSSSQSRAGIESLVSSDKLFQKNDIPMSDFIISQIEKRKL